MKVLFAGGGTAGHINPALAIAGYIREKEPNAKLLYIGNKGGMEERLVPAAGFAFKTITISGFQRKLTPKHIVENFKTVGRIFTSSNEAKRLIQEFKPDICIGTGGYVSGPVIRAAIKLGVPSVIHEQNAFPGMTNKMLAKQATKVLLAVEDARQYFETDQCVLTGNPVRQEIIEICELFNVNPYELQSLGCLLMTADNDCDIINILNSNNIPAAVIGRIVKGNQRILHNKDEERFLTLPNQDEIFRCIKTAQ